MTRRLDALQVALDAALEEGGELPLVLRRHIAALSWNMGIAHGYIADAGHKDLARCSLIDVSFAGTRVAKAHFASARWSSHTGWVPIIRPLYRWSTERGPSLPRWSAAYTWIAQRLEGRGMAVGMHPPDAARLGEHDARLDELVFLDGLAGRTT